MNRSATDVVIVFNDLTEFYAVQYDISEIVERGIALKVYIVTVYSDKMYTETKKMVRQRGYEVVSKGDKIHCKVLLEPYPIHHRYGDDITSEFRIRYEYGVTAASLKPNPVYSPEWNIPFDAEVCYSHISENILSVYSKACLIKPTQFKNFKPHKKLKKTNVLILLTWGEDSVVSKLEEIKSKLGDEYNLIIKAHHAVEYRPDHDGVVDILKSVADEYYDSSTNVNELFSKADVVLSDNSSAIFTAIYLGIPAAIYTESESDYHSIGGLKAAHFWLLMEPNRIAHTDSIDSIKSIIIEAQDRIDDQNILKNELFPSDVKDTLADVVSLYINMDRKTNPYYILKDLLYDKRREQEKHLSDIKSTLQEKDRRNKELVLENKELRQKVANFLGIRRSARLLAGNIKRKIM